MTKTLLFSKWRWKYLAMLLVLCALAYFSVQRWLGPQVVAEVVQRRDFVQSVVASGHVQSPHRVDIGAQITATVARVPVAEGQTVAAGTLLIELLSADLQAAERQADIAVQQAQAKLRQLLEVQAPVAEQALRQAQATQANAQSAFKRSQDLFKQGFIGQAALDEARKSADLADAQLRSAHKQLDTTAASGSDYAMASTAVDQARAAAQVAHARAGYASIRSPVDGVLIARNVEAGDVVQPGKVLMTLSPKGKTQIVIAVDEKNLHLIALGQQALVSADAYPHERFKAEISYIAPAVDAQRGSVEVRLRVPEPPAYLKHEMTVSIDVAAAQRANIVLIPADTLRDALSATPWVMVVRDGETRRQNVTLGLRGTGKVEVREGVAAGEALLPAAATISEGRRVSAVDR